MKKIIVTILSSIIGIASFAQEKDRKNEISVNISPILNMAEINTNGRTLSIFYKRDGNKFIKRIGLYNKIFSYNEEINEVSISDKSLIFKEIHTYSNISNIRIGLEKNLEKEFFSFYYGADLIIGGSSFQEWENFKVYKKIDDSTFQKIHYTEFQDYVSSEESRKNNKNIKTLDLGISPIVGFNFKLNELFRFGIFIPANIYYSAVLSSNNYSNSEVIKFDQTFQFLISAKF